MTKQEILISLMRSKKNILSISIGQKPASKYFSSSDEQEIKGWKDIIYLDYALDIMLSSRQILSPKSCPFCLYYSNNCNICGYSKRHGVCGSDSSDDYSYVRDCCAGQHSNINDQWIEVTKNMRDKMKEK